MINLRRILGRKRVFTFFKDLVDLNRNIHSLWIFDKKGKEVIKYPEADVDFAFNSSVNAQLIETKEFIPIPGGIASSIKFNDQVLGTIIGFSNDAESRIADFVLFAKKEATIFIKESIEKRELIEETLNVYREINLLYEVGEDIISCLDLAQIAEIILDKAKKTIAVDNGSIMLFNKTTNNFDILSAFGNKSKQKVILRIGKGIAGDVFKRGYPEIINKVKSDSRWVDSSDDIHSILCVPLKTKNKAWGIINLSRNNRHIEFTARDLKLLNALATLSSVAIDNIKKIEEIEAVNKLKRYLAPQVVENILTKDIGKLMKGHRREVTVVFIDLRGFTYFAENNKPEKIMEVLGQFYNVMGKLIFDYKGTLERFTGDGAMIFFNDPVLCENHQMQAVRMAINMQESMCFLLSEWEKYGYKLGLRIGIDKGIATLGPIGFEERFDYACIGTVTNLAARLCNIANVKQIIVTEDFLKEINDRVIANPCGIAQLKGISKPITKYNIVGLGNNNNVTNT